MATDRCHVLEDPWGDQAIPVRFDEPDTAARTIAAAGPFDGVIAVGDRPTLIAALAARQMALRYNSPESVDAARNKYLSRQRFEAVGMPVPRYFRVPLGDSADAAGSRADYPCVLKPLGLSASRGVIRANNRAEFVAAFRRIEALLARPEIRVQRDEQNHYLQIESFIEGREFALEGVVSDGVLKTLAVFEKPDPLDGPFFEETIYITPARADCSVLIGAAAQAVRALGLTQGPIHAELRYDGRTAWILEVAARPIGGLCAKTLRFTAGMSLEELLIRHAVGEDVSQAQLEPGSSGVMMIPIDRAGVYEGVDHVDVARAIPGITEIEITAKPGYPLEPLPEGATYLGFIFARGPGPKR